MLACSELHALHFHIFVGTTYGQLDLPWCTHAMQSMEPLQVACELAVVHVAEGAAYGLAAEAAAAAANEVRAATGAERYGLPFHSLALEDVFAEDAAALQRACVTEREAFRGNAYAEDRAAAACGLSDASARGAQAGGAHCREGAAHEASADVAAAVPASAAELCEQGSGSRPPPAGSGGACNVPEGPSGAAGGSVCASGLSEHPVGAAVASGGDNAACVERRERRERLAALLAVRLKYPLCVQPIAPAMLKLHFVLARSSSAGCARSMLGAAYHVLPHATRLINQCSMTVSLWNLTRGVAAAAAPHPFSQPQNCFSLEAHAQAVPDATGREDLVGALRLRLLLAAAAALGCNRLALGDSATRLAARAVALAAKGAGHALPASLQHFDARRACGRVIAPIWHVFCSFAPTRAPWHRAVLAAHGHLSLGEVFETNNWLKLRFLIAASKQPIQSSNSQGAAQARCRRAGGGAPGARLRGARPGPGLPHVAPGHGAAHAGAEP